MHREKKCQIRKAARNPPRATRESSQKEAVNRESKNNSKQKPSKARRKPAAKTWPRNPLREVCGSRQKVPAKPARFPRKTATKASLSRRKNPSLRKKRRSGQRVEDESKAAVPIKPAKVAAVKAAAPVKPGPGQSRQAAQAAETPARQPKCRNCPRSQAASGQGSMEKAQRSLAATAARAPPRTSCALQGFVRRQGCCAKQQLKNFRGREGGSKKVSKLSSMKCAGRERIIKRATRHGSPSPRTSRTAAAAEARKARELVRASSGSWNTSTSSKPTCASAVVHQMRINQVSERFTIDKERVTAMMRDILHWRDQEAARSTSIHLDEEEGERREGEPEIAVRMR